MRRVCGEYLNSQQISIMADRKELLERTPEDLVDLILALRSDNEAVRGEVTAAEVKLLNVTKKCNEMKATLAAGASQLHKYQDLEETMMDLEKQNNTLSKKVEELEELNGTMEASIPLQQEEIDQLNKRKKDLITKNASLEEALSSTRDTFKAEMDGCKEEKEKIRDTMQETVTSLRERIHGLNKEESNKETIITDISNKCERLNNQLLALRQVETEQRRSLSNASEQHQRDQKSMKMIRDSLSEELRQSKAECKALRERLESTQERMNAMAKSLVSGRDKCKSPLAKTLEQERKAKAGDDEKRFLTIGSKTTGRKSPLGTGASLDPKELARKIKYRF